MPDYHAALVIDIGTTNCKVSCYSCHDVSVLEVRKFPTPTISSDKGEVDFDIEALWQALRLVMAELVASVPFPVKISVLRVSVSLASLWIRRASFLPRCWHGMIDVVNLISRH